MNKCVVCGESCDRSICTACLGDLEDIDEPVVVRFLHASAGRDKVIEKKSKPIESLDEDEIDDNIQ